MAFVRALDALTGWDVHHAGAQRKWGDLTNGKLQEIAVEDGYTHMVSYDLSMADKHPAALPVILADDPAKTTKKKPRSASERQATQAAVLRQAAVVMDAVRGGTVNAIGYHGIRTPGLRTSSKLRRILRCEHYQHPQHQENYDARLRKEISEGQARKSTKNHA